MSLTVKRKFNVRETELKASIFAIASPPGSGPVTNWPARIVESLGKNRVGDVVDGNDNQFGPVSFVGDATLALPVVVVLSFCSQL